MEQQELLWQVDSKGSTLIDFGSCTDYPAVVFHNFFTEGQADSCPFMFSGIGESLEHHKKLVGILLLEPDAIIAKDQPDKFLIARRSYGCGNFIIRYIVTLDSDDRACFRKLQ